MISIIVPARNNSELTARCLGTLLFSVSRLKLNCEFILIDDHSSEDERILDVFRKHRAAAVGHECRIVRAKRQQHYSGVFSIGLHLATREIIFFISNDMLVTPTFLQAQLIVSALSPDFGIVRGTSNYTDSHPEHQVEPVTPVRSFEDITKFSASVFNNAGAQFVEDRVLSGDAVLIKRDLVKKIGVLDLRFFGYFGDVDYGMRAHLAGFKLVCAKGAWLYHVGGGHVKREVVKAPNANVEVHVAKRMALVETAYQEFRRKWSMELPPTYPRTGPLLYFDMARANAEKVQLKYNPPPTFMDEFEIHHEVAKALSLGC